jgi:hypothetical protein
MQQKHPQSPAHKKFKAQESASKVMLTFSFDHQEPLLLKFKEPEMECPLMPNNITKHWNACIQPLRRSIQGI